MSVWTGALYAYKGLLLLFGVYMAWETRHVKIPVLNDSHQIGISIYNVVLCSGTVVALSSLLQQRPTLAYCVVSILVFISTTSLQLFLFLPKVRARFPCSLITLLKLHYIISNKTQTI
jgi:gamma-aminobutyric acid type B receptor